jgi:hypothetical protein
LEAVLRRYIVGHALLWDYVMEEAVRVEGACGELAGVWGGHGAAGGLGNGCGEAWGGGWRVGGCGRGRRSASRVKNQAPAVSSLAPLCRRRSARTARRSGRLK